MLFYTFNLVGHFFKKIRVDSKSPVQEKVLDVLISYVRAINVNASS